METRNGDDEEPQLQNNEEKSYILAPFNSIKYMFVENPHPNATPEEIEEHKARQNEYKWPDEILNMIVPRRHIKFLKKCRGKNRIYEQNNNADLDNGVYNEFVNEQEKEEGALYKKDSDESDYEEEKVGQHSPAMSRKSSKDFKESAEDNDEHDSSQSSDSLQKSFKETELSSDDEKASE